MLAQEWALPSASGTPTVVAARAEDAAGAQESDGFSDVMDSQGQDHSHHTLRIFWVYFLDITSPGKNNPKN